MSSFVIDACYYDGEQTENIRVEIGEELSAPQVSANKVSVPELLHSKDESRIGCDKRVVCAGRPSPEASNPKVSDPTATKSSFVVNTCFYNGEETETIQVKFGDELCGRKLPVSEVSDPKVCVPEITHPEVKSRRPQKHVQTETIRVEFSDEVSGPKICVPSKISAPNFSQREVESPKVRCKIVTLADYAQLVQKFLPLILILLFAFLCINVYLNILPSGIPQDGRPRVYVPPVQEYYRYLKFSYRM